MVLQKDLNQCMLFNPGYGEQALRVVKDDFIEEKILKQYIRNIERLVRTSPEYKNWLTFVHGVLGMNYMCYQSGETTITCNIHLHHHPLTLYDYVVICIENSNHFDTFQIAEEVMALHFTNSVGFIPLCSTVHEKYHNQALNIPIELVEGDWCTFVEENKSRIPEYMINTIEVMSSVNLDNVSDTWFMRQKNYIDVNVKTVVDNLEVIAKSRANVKESWMEESVDYLL